MSTKPLSTADGKRSRRNILASSAPHPLFLSPSFLPLLARRVLDSKQLSSLAPIVSYLILQSPRLSFFHRPRSHLIATGLVWVAAAQHSPKPPRICSHPGWWAQQNAADGQDFAVTSTPLICVRSVSSKVDCGSLICFRSLHVCFRQQDSSLDLLSPVLTRSRYCPAPVRVLGIATSGKPTHSQIQP
jgi:hypothetical protein